MARRAVAPEKLAVRGTAHRGRAHRVRARADARAGDAAHRDARARAAPCARRARRSQAHRLRGQRMRGFTLIEVLVALASVAVALLGIMGVVCWRGLNYAATQRERIERESDELGKLLRTLSQIERDLAQRVPEPMLPAPAVAQELPASIAVSAADGAVALEIMRLAPEAAGPARAQRIVYRTADGPLVRI